MWSQEIIHWKFVYWVVKSTEKVVTDMRPEERVEDNLSGFYKEWGKTARKGSSRCY